ncbi:MAG: hypothetical protein RR579_06340 [Eubacterium sp.]
MARVIDITSKLKNEAPVVKIGDKEYEVDNHKDTMLALAEKPQEPEGMAKEIDKTLECLLGKKALEEINAIGLRMPDLKVVFIAVMAAASDEEYEVVEKRFQES